MKKFFLLISLVVLLTGCDVISEAPVLQPSIDGIQVDHGTVLGKVMSFGPSAVGFSLDLESKGEGTEMYEFAPGFVIHAMKDGKLTDFTPEEYMAVELDWDSVYYYFVISGEGNEVFEMTQAYVPGENYDSNSADLVYINDVYERDGKEFVSVDPMEFLNVADGTCNNSSTPSDLPACGGSGFLLANKEVESIEYEIPSDKTVFFVMGIYGGLDIPMNFADFQKKFARDEASFATLPTFYSTPYHLKTDGNQVRYLIEKYIP